MFKSIYLDVKRMRGFHLTTIWMNAFHLPSYFGNKTVKYYKLKSLYSCGNKMSIKHL